ncbi:Protein W05F2.4 a [Aphelenchoides avenae]|nr:Protein W05F2.4 a [Aphelenchus avenae]
MSTLTSSRTSRFGSSKTANITAEPNTAGTSWTSVRWNRPLSAGYRGHSTRLANTFEGSSSMGLTNNTTGGSSTATGRDASAGYRSRDVFSPARATRDVFSPARGIRDVFSPTRATPSYTSSDRSNVSYLASKLTSTRSPSSTASTATETRRTPVKHPGFVIAAQRANASSAYVSVPTFTNGPDVKTTSMAIAGAMKPIPKESRPWRQRLAESARLRDAHGDDNKTASAIAASRASRRSSTDTQSRTDELRTSLNKLKSYMSDRDQASDHDSAYSKYLTRPATDYSSGGSSASSALRSMPSTTRYRSSNASMVHSYTPLTHSAPPPSARNVMSKLGLEQRPSRLRSVSSYYRYVPPVPMPTRSRFGGFLSGLYVKTRENLHRSPTYASRPLRYTSYSSPFSSSPAYRRYSSSAHNRNHSYHNHYHPHRVHSTSRARFYSRSYTPGSTASGPRAFFSGAVSSIASRFGGSLVTSRERASRPGARSSAAGTSNLSSVKEEAMEKTTRTARSDSKTRLRRRSRSKGSIPPPSSSSDEDKAPGKVPQTPPRRRKKRTPSLPRKENKETENGPTAGPPQHSVANATDNSPSATQKTKMPPNGSAGEVKKTDATSPKPKTKIQNGKQEIHPSVVNGVKKTITSTKLSDKVIPTIKTPKVTGAASDTVSVSNDLISSTDNISEILNEDESKYNAVTQFKPASTVQRRLQSKSKSPSVTRPVPGTWSGGCNELFISQNKHLIRKDNVESMAVEVICKDIPHAKANHPRAIRVVPKRKKISVVNKKIDAALKSKASRKEAAAIKLRSQRPKLTYKVAGKTFKVPVKAKPVTAVAVINKDLANKRRLRLGIEKLLRLKGFRKECTRLVCRAVPKESATSIKLNIIFKEQHRAATVTVLATDIVGVNFDEKKLHIKMPTAPLVVKKKLPAKKLPIAQASAPPKIQVPAKAPVVKAPSIVPLKKKEPEAVAVSLPVKTVKQPKADAETTLSVPLLSTHVPCVNYEPGSPIVLPDQSVLEEYVARKRGQLERLKEDPYSAGIYSPGSSHADSPRPEPELQPACSVRIVEPPVRAVAQISSPNRLRHCSVESGQGSNRNSGMLECISYNEQFAAPSVQPANAFRRALKAPPVEALKNTAVFDAPKTLFEAAIQKNAKVLRRASHPAQSENDAVEVPQHQVHQQQVPVQHHGRRTSTDSSNSGGVGGVAAGFTAAIAAAQPRHERYAAHIPVSGRQSTTSMDSTNSGALDTASKQLDQMIDQARYRHHQHRSKFKDAIDYLDQIFEDLKRDVDQPPATAADKKVNRPQPTTQGVQNAKAAFQKSGPPANEPPVAVKMRARKPGGQPIQPQSVQVQSVQPQNSNRIPLQQQQPMTVPRQPVRKQEPVPVDRRPKPFPTDREATDVDVTETIVLPSKSTAERLDFTRQWLVDDIKSWADKPDLIATGQDTGADSDEHSLGSCSAEVAAINSSDRARKRNVRETPDIIKSSKTNVAKPTIVQPSSYHNGNGLPKVSSAKNINEITPIRPQPYRPQPQFGAFPTSLNPEESYYELQKAPSHDCIRNTPGYYQDRAPSQDYQSVGSVHSTDGYQPPLSLSLYSNSLQRGGAFMQVPQRGSIHSLPDATAFQRPVPRGSTLSVNQPYSTNDPVLAIDALVAELELNTEPTTVSDKRRSFPTMQSEVGHPQRKTSDVVHTHTSRGMAVGPRQPPQVPVKPMSSFPAAPDRLQAPTLSPAMSAGSMDRGMRRIQQQQKASLDDVADMLNDVAGTLKSVGKQHPSHQAPPSQHTTAKKQVTGRVASLERPAPSEKSNNPFETINQERLNPSRVEAIQHMFEGNKPDGGSKPAGVGWRKNVPQRNRSREEDAYCEIGEFNGRVPHENPQNRPQIVVGHGSVPAPSNNNGSFRNKQPLVQRTTVMQNAAPMRQEPLPSFPMSQPPQGPPSVLNGHGAQPSKRPLQHVSSFSGYPGQQSIEEDEEMEDIYDNIGDHLDRRYSGNSEMDNNSLSSHKLPPVYKAASGAGRIGQLIRKIGGSSSKVPASGASSLSLNKVGHEVNGVGHGGLRGGLMKSSSLSNEPWKIHVMNKEPVHESKNGSGGIGNRLKQAFFGSKPRMQN